MDHAVRTTKTKAWDKLRFENAELECLYQRYTLKMQRFSVIGVVSLFVIFCLVMATLSFFYSNAFTWHVSFIHQFPVGAVVVVVVVWSRTRGRARAPHCNVHRAPISFHLWNSRVASWPVHLSDRILIKSVCLWMWPLLLLPFVVSEYIHFADGTSIFNNSGIATISCHTRYVFAVAVLWNTGDCNNIMCDVDAIAQQIHTDRHQGGKNFLSKHHENRFFFLSVFANCNSVFALYCSE